MADRPSWFRSVASLIGYVAIGALGLAGATWLAVQALPDSPDEVEIHLGPEDEDPVPLEVVETGLAPPGAAEVQVDRCEVVDGVIEAAGIIQNLSHRNQAFVLHLAVLVDDRLFDGTLTEIGVPLVATGQVAGWSERIGAVDPDAPPRTLECRIDRIALAQELPA